MKSSYWYRPAAVHCFRTFFRYKRDGAIPTSPAKKRRHDAVRQTLEQFSEWDRRLLEDYFSAPWGTDVDLVKEIAARSHVPEFALWRTIHAAQRALFVVLGVLDENED